MFDGGRFEFVSLFENENKNGYLLMDVEILMQQAIQMAQQGIEQGQSPFGCAIAIGDEVIAVAHNTVIGPPIARLMQRSMRYVWHV